MGISIETIFVQSAVLHFRHFPQDCNNYVKLIQLELDISNRVLTFQQMPNHTTTLLHAPSVEISFSILTCTLQELQHPHVFQVVLTDSLILYMCLLVHLLASAYICSGFSLMLLFPFLLCFPSLSLSSMPSPPFSPLLLPTGQNRCNDLCLFAT